MKHALRFGVSVCLAAGFAVGIGCSSSSGGGSASTSAGSSQSSSGSAAGTTHAADGGSTSAAAGAVNAAAGAAGVNLTSMLGSSLGVTSDQAAGGVGSILTLAQEKLPASDYSQVANAIPGASGYVQKAKDLGAVTGKVGDLNGLNAAYSKLGISPEVASKFTPMVVTYVGKAAGGNVGSLLSSVLQ